MGNKLNGFNAKPCMNKIFVPHTHCVYIESVCILVWGNLEVGKCGNYLRRKKERERKGGRDRYTHTL